MKKATIGGKPMSSPDTHIIGTNVEIALKKKAEKTRARARTRANGNARGVEREAKRMTEQ